MPRLLTAAALTLALLAPLPLAAETHYTAAPGAAELSAAATGEVLLVDIRRPEEWRETGVLPEAVLLTYDAGPDAFLAALAPHLAAGRPLALICRTGNRTAQAAAELAPRLPVPVIDIAGGMFRLMAEGYTPSPPTRAAGCTTC